MGTARLTNVVCGYLTLGAQDGSASGLFTVISPPSSPVVASPVWSSPDDPLDVPLPLLDPAELLLLLVPLPLLPVRPPLLELDPANPESPGDEEVVAQCARTGAIVQTARAATRRKRRFDVIDENSLEAERLGCPRRRNEPKQSAAQEAEK
jgi:hypothetical protein